MAELAGRRCQYDGSATRQGQGWGCSPLSVCLTQQERRSERLNREREREKEREREREGEGENERRGVTEGMRDREEKKRKKSRLQW